MMRRLWIDMHGIIAVAGTCIPRMLTSALAAAALVAAANPAAAAVGDVFVYRAINGYNGEPRGTVTYRVDTADAGRIVMSVTTDAPALGAAHTEIYAPDGNWIRHPLTNHDQPVEYEFHVAYPAYEFPLETGKSWSVRVDAVDPASGRRNSVRVDGEVLGSERVTTPAGAFDTIKVRRRTYAGDWDGFRYETNIVETDWYAPALGRAVKSESNSDYYNPSRCGRGPCRPIRGDWNIFVLAETTADKR